MARVNENILNLTRDSYSDE